MLDQWPYYWNPSTRIAERYPVKRDHGSCRRGDRVPLLDERKRIEQEQGEPHA